MAYFPARAGLIFSAIIFVLTFAAAPAFAERRVAFVVGNSAYHQKAILPNARNDAHAIATQLRKFNFEVIDGYNLNRTAFLDRADAFFTALKGADVGLFFYAGHGIQVKGKNYLLPTDTRLTSEVGLAKYAIELDLVLRQMDKLAKIKLVFMDACRNNPLAQPLVTAMGQSRALGVGRGLARIKSGIGALVGYATAPGEIAYDGNSKHSPYTTAILNHIKTPGLEVGQMMRRVRDEVYRTTDGRQVPWESSSLTGRPFIFNVLITPGKNDPYLAFEAARNLGNCSAYKEFVASFPDTYYARLARTQIEKLCKAKKVAIAKPDKPKAPKNNRQLARSLQTELKRLACLRGPIDGIWGADSSTALARFSGMANVAFETLEPSEDALGALKATQQPICAAVRTVPLAAKPQNLRRKPNRPKTANSTNTKRSGKSRCKKRGAGAAFGGGFKGVMC